MQQQDVAHTEKAFVAKEGGKENRVKVFWTQFKNGNDQEKPNAFMFNAIIFDAFKYTFSRHQRVENILIVLTSTTYIYSCDRLEII